MSAAFLQMPAPVVPQLQANTCSHGLPRRAYLLPYMGVAHICAYCAFEIGERCGFKPNYQHIEATFAEMFRNQYFRRIGWERFCGSDAFLDHLEFDECDNCCLNARYPESMCMRGYQLFIERYMESPL